MSNTTDFEYSEYGYKMIRIFGRTIFTKNLRAPETKPQGVIRKKRLVDLLSGYNNPLARQKEED